MRSTHSRVESWRSRCPSRWTDYLSSRLMLSSIPDSGDANISIWWIGSGTTYMSAPRSLRKISPTHKMPFLFFIFVIHLVPVRQYDRPIFFVFSFVVRCRLSADIFCFQFRSPLWLINRFFVIVRPFTIGRYVFHIFISYLVPSFPRYLVSSF